jgi:hypothetical protein
MTGMSTGDSSGATINVGRTALRPAPHLWASLTADDREVVDSAAADGDRSLEFAVFTARSPARRVHRDPDRS